MDQIKKIIKKSLKLSNLWRLVNRVCKYNPLILMYHGLTIDPDNADWTQVSVRNFEKQMIYIKQNFNIVKIDNLCKILRERNVKPYIAAITFDDGYESVYQYAYPILKKLNIPATIYLTSNFIRNNHETVNYLWPDYVVLLINSAKGELLDLEVFGLGKYSISTRERKRVTACKLNESLKSIINRRRKEVIDHLKNLYQVNFDINQFTAYDSMTWKQASELLDSNLISIGAHTRNHPILSQLDTDELEDEIEGGKNDINSILNTEVNGFAYPNGRLEDISEMAINIVTKNFKYAVTTEPGRNTVKDCHYMLRRIGIGSDVSFNDFKVLISGAFYIFQKPLRTINIGRKYD